MINLYFKMSVKMNLRITMKNDAADPEIRFLTKSISKPNGSVIPTALEFKKKTLKISMRD